MIKVVLLDDEYHCLESLETQLKSLNKPIEIIARFSNPIEALPYLRAHVFDILFMDIEMPGLNGFDVLEQLPEHSFAIVFTTAYNQYAIKAFKFSALNYLLKPIDDEELLGCINQWEKKAQKNISIEQYRLFLDILNPLQKTPSKIALPTAEGFEFIAIDQIIRCRSESNYTFFYLNNNIEVLICRTLKEVERILVNYGFIRIHQSHLINQSYLKKFVRHNGGYVVMQDGEEISVSKINKDKITVIFNQIDRK